MEQSHALRLCAGFARAGLLRCGVAGGYWTVERNAQLDTVLLRSFVTAAELEGFSAAARELGLAQSALSQHIAKLEDRLGARLFDRAGRGVALTPGGRALLPRAKALIEASDALPRQLEEDLRGGRVQMRVGSIPTVSPSLMPGVLSNCKNKHPDVTITFTEQTTDNLIASLLSFELDLAFMALPIEDERLLYEPIGEERLVLIAPPGDELLSKDMICAPDLDERGIISLREPHCLGTHVREFCGRSSVRHTVACETTQLSTIERFVERGLGVTLLPEISAWQSRSDALGYRPLRENVRPRTIVAVWHADRERDPTARCMTHAAQDEFEAQISHARAWLADQTVCSVRDDRL
ncbi:MAG: LysR family transcriptional regulator [Planctomycetota bacterium]